MTSAQSSRVFWVRLDSGAGELSDPFRVKFQAPEGTGDGGWKDAAVEDLKEQMMLQNSSLFEGISGRGSLPPLPWVSLLLPPSKEGEGSSKEEFKLSPSSDLGSLPDGAGSSSWHLVARVAVLTTTGRLTDPTPPRPSGKPLTLYEQGLAGEDEPEQIKNATDLSQLYPGGKLPVTSSSGSFCSQCCKVVLIFGAFFVFAFCITYFLSVTLPALTGMPAELPTPRAGFRKPDLKALFLGRSPSTGQRMYSAGSPDQQVPARPIQGDPPPGSPPGGVSDGGGGNAGSTSTDPSGADRTEL